MSVFEFQTSQPIFELGPAKPMWPNGLARPARYPIKTFSLNNISVEKDRNAYIPLISFGNVSKEKRGVRRRGEVPRT